MPSEAFFFIINIIHSKPHNRLLHEKINKLEFISINTRTRIKKDIKIETKIIKKKRAKQKDRLLLEYNTNQAVEALIKAEKN